MPSVGKRVISPPIKHVISYSSEGLRGTSSTSVVTVSDEPVNRLVKIPEMSTERERFLHRISSAVKLCSATSIH